MSNTAVLLSLVAIQVTFTALDLGWRWRTRATRYDGERLRWPAAAFLVGAVVVYLLLQFGGLALVPTADQLMARFGVFAVELTGIARAPDPVSGWPLVALVVAAFYAGGLVDYLLHRFFNHSRRFWWTHEYHHLPNQVFVALPGLSARPFSVFTAFPTAAFTIAFAYGFLALLGQPLGQLDPLRALALINAAILMTSHSAFLRQWRWPHRLGRLAALTTPHEHLLHHAIDLDGNYGNLTTLWDRVFGTYLDPERPEHAPGGLALGLSYDQDFLGTLTFSRFKLPNRLRKALQLERYCNLDPLPDNLSPRGPIP